MPASSRLARFFNIRRPWRDPQQWSDPAERYRVGTTTLAPGDTLVLLTDGLTEVQNAAGRELGLDAIRRTLTARGREPVDDLRRAILTLAESHGPQIDDQSIVLIRRE